ncbi:tocopherol cyclase family protein [Sporosalibacterium faouarense]|uniref:tocopherol cyclase family protein n=1 Tax=Sporosalibacterium faouarense TaxID=516123 RepID=UPI00141C18D3|nr:tocopherol cyclase family protein [Sporosalibacterium faouarense]MTI48681.1 hypothetical protein [Bacillota bacterium]
MAFYRIKKIWKPDIYQGANKKDKYFEGWYFKVVDDNCNNTYAFIPGISIDKKNKSSHAFIQIIDGNQCSTEYVKYGIEEFRYSKERFEIIIGDNLFSKNQIDIDIKKSNNNIRGKLQFEDITPWPVKPLSPGIMGWYAFVPFMECYHGILSLDHRVKGTLNFKDKKIEISKGRGYIEKDWGRSFPKGWIWIQTNHFEERSVSLTVSLAEIPWLGRNFTGFIIGLLYKNKLYKFTTYNGGKINLLEINKDRITLTVSNKEYQLEIRAIKGKGVKLYAPNQGIMDGRVNESLSSKVWIRLTHRGNDSKIIYEGNGRNAGIEISNPKRLLFQ